MNRLGLVIDGGDHFFGPILPDLKGQFRVCRFVPRFIRAPVVSSSINKMLLQLELAQFMRQHDIVFFEWAGSLLVQATRMRKVCEIVTRLHSIEVATSASLVNWEQVDAVIVVSEHMKSRLLGFAKTPPRELKIINYGVDLSRFHPVRRPFQHRIGMVCRVVPIKRVYEMVLCLYELRRRGYPFTLQVLGELGDDQSPRYPLALLTLVEKLGLTNDVRFWGRVEDPAPYLRDIDIFVSNSYWEGQQVALLEAMASGCYCLSHCWGGAEEVLPEQNIFVTDSDLAAKLLVFASLSDEAKKRAQAQMRQIAEAKFDQRTMVHRIVDVIGKVADH